MSLEFEWKTEYEDEKMMNRMEMKRKCYVRDFKVGFVSSFHYENLLKFFQAENFHLALSSSNV